MSGLGGPQTPASGRVAIVAIVLIGLALILWLVLRPGGGPLDRAALVSEGDAICRANNARLRELQATSEVPLERAERALGAAERLNAPGFDTTRRLRALVPEPELAPAYSEFIRLRLRRDRLAEQVVVALRAGDSRRAANAQHAALALYDGPIRDSAEKLGFKVCGQPVV